MNDQMTEEEVQSDRLDGVRVLIVDDDRDVVDTFRMALEAEGAEVSVATDGNTGVRRATEEKPDLVVLDLMLPGRSGFLALEKIKGRSDSPSVIMVTANEGRRHAEYAEQMGVDAYLVKPVPLGQLIEHIERLTASA